MYRSMDKASTTVSKYVWNSGWNFRKYVYLLKILGNMYIPWASPGINIFPKTFSKYTYFLIIHISGDIYNTGYNHITQLSIIDFNVTKFEATLESNPYRSTSALAGINDTSVSYRAFHASVGHLGFHPESSSRTLGHHGSKHFRRGSTIVKVIWMKELGSW